MSAAHACAATLGYPGKTTLSDFAAQQLETMPQHLAQFKLWHQQTLQLGQDSANLHSVNADSASCAAIFLAILFEFTRQSPEIGLVHQLIMCTAQGKNVLNFTGSQPGSQCSDFLGILEGFSSLI